MLDLAIVLAFVAFSITMGMRARRQASRGLGDYFLAGRNLKGWQSGTSMAATQFAADTPLLVAGLVATGGIFLLWRLWIYGLAFILLGFIFATHWQRSGVITDAELTELRYSGHGVLPLRVVKAIYYGTILNCAVLAMVLVAAIGIAEAFLPWHQWLPAAMYQPVHSLVEWSGIEITSALGHLDPAVATANNIISIFCILLFTALYSMTGGLRGVVATDIMQFILAMLGTLIFAWIIVREVGGLKLIPTQLTEHYGERGADMISFMPQFAGNEWALVLLPFVVIIALQWIFQAASDGTGYLAQRSMACSDHREARIAGVTFAWLQILARSLPWLLIAVGLLIIYPFSPVDAQQAEFAATRELTFVQGINDLMPIGARGLLLTGMLAALASTLDTHMNWGASYWSNDIYNRLVCRQWLKREPGGHELVVVARLSNVLILIIALVVMVNLGSIQQAWHLTLLFGAGVGSVLILRWLWERINLWSEIAAMLVSIGVAPMVMWFTTHGSDRGWFGADDALAVEAIGLTIMAVVSTIAAVGVTFFTPLTEPQRLRAFYERVQPVGFWHRTAAAAGDDGSQRPAMLRTGVRHALLTAASLYLCLYGAARLLIPHPDTPAILPVASLLIGLALVPWWWRHAVRAR